MTPGKPVVLITGAPSGLGKDVPLQLLHPAYTVYGPARRVERKSDFDAAMPCRAKP